MTPRPPSRPAVACANHEPPTREDLERDPDGIPHAVIGLTVLISVALALSIAMLFSTGSTAGRVGAIVLGLTALPILVSNLHGMATRGRDQVHPSR